MTKYDESFEPPAPVAKIALREIETGKRVKDIPMLLDTGADISLLPSSTIKNLKIKPLQNETFELEGIYGSQKSVEVFYLQVIFLGKRFTGKYCVIDDEIGILGRDVLNQVSILFDGLNLSWQEIIEQINEI
ncbi:MAG: aspartyl protease family protein [Acidobacteriota bacterium]|nr:aspartyl protease family protein [Acidobacteriota bacterium]